MGIGDRARRSLSEELTAEARAAAAQRSKYAEQRAWPYHYSLNRKAQRAVNEFAREMQELSIPPEPLYLATCSDDRRVWTATGQWWGWRLFGIAVTTDCKLVGIENVLTSANAGCSYEGFRQSDVGELLFVVRQVDPRTIGPNDSFKTGYSSGTPDAYDYSNNSTGSPVHAALVWVLENYLVRYMRNQNG